MAFDQSTRNRLQKFVSESRSILTEEFTRQLQAIYGMDPKNGSVADLSSLSFLDNQGRQTAVILRETLEHYKASLTIKSEKERNKQGIERIIREQSFTILNRLGALRMAEARGFLLESVAKGYSSKGFQLYKNLAGSALGETGAAYQQYLFSIFDEFSEDLAVLFDRNSSQGLLFPRESALLSLLDQVNHFEIENLWVEDETIGWIYQYFNSQEERKKMRSESQAPRNSRELAVRNQFFTPRYVVEFLTDNTLGRIWYEMTQGKTALVENCRYLVRRPNEIFLAKGESAPGNESEKQESVAQEELLKQPVYIPFRELKDPRELRLLDPACGSMHFGLYAFDLFEEIYKEAWQLETELGPELFIRSKGMIPLQATYSSFNEFRKEIPSLIIECNIHGVDIDPRAVQIAGLSLWQRAQRVWHQMGIKPNQRPTIKKSNIVCAEPMPGEKEMLLEFTEKLNPPILGQLVETIFDKMELAGEAGTLLKIEEEIASTINKAKDEFNKELLRRQEEQGYFAGMAPRREATMFDFAELTDETSFWDTAEESIIEALSAYADQAESEDGIKRLFAEDAAKGFAFIDLCQKRFDVVLMNPPFGSPTTNKKVSKYISSVANNNLYAAFVEIGIKRLVVNGCLGAITDRTFMLLPTYEAYREKLLENGLVGILDLGWGVLDDAQVATSAYVVRNSSNRQDCSWFIDARDLKDKSLFLSNSSSKKIHLNFIQKKVLESVPTIPFSYWAPENIRVAFLKHAFLEDTYAIVRKGLSPGDSNRFVKLSCEVPQDQIGMGLAWAPYANGGSFSPYYRPNKEVLNWSGNGREIRSFCNSDGKPRYVIRSENLYGIEGITFGKRGEVLNLQVINKGHVFSNEGYIIKPHDNCNIDSLLVYLNSSVSRYLVNMIAGLHKEVGAVKKIPVPKEIISDPRLSKISKEMVSIASDLNKSELLRHGTVIEECCNYDNIKVLLSQISKHRKNKFEILKQLAEDVNRICFQYFNLTDNEQSVVQKEINRLSPEWKTELYYNKDSILKELISNAIGEIFGWIKAKDQLKITVCIWNDDLAKTTVSLIDNSFRERDSIDIIIQEVLSVESLDAYLRKPLSFFDYHFSLFSKNSKKAPIYWPLQTPTGSYTLWVYYHRLTEQTLYTCVNDFLEGPKGKLTGVTDALNGLRNKSVRSGAEEKELETLTDMEAELKDFRDELLRLVKFWKPNLNDGVQITAAPLWKLFQHKQWQKKLKETWDKLEKGEYDWAHMAFNIWPERVLRKCHEDRSLAIAHDVENVFWEEIEIPVIRRGKDTGETKVEWQPKKLNEDELKEIITQKIAELK